jgi:hypothetical protein
MLEQCCSAILRIESEKLKMLYSGRGNAEESEGAIQSVWRPPYVGKGKPTHGAMDTIGFMLQQLYLASSFAASRLCKV